MNLSKAYADLTDAVRIERVVAWLPTTRTGGTLLVVLAVFVAVFPLIILRGYHFEEGLTVALAEDAMRGAHWYDPQLYGFRFVERPVLQSWIVALISAPFGTVTQLTARLPTVAALLASALMIHHLLNGRVSAAAALFGAFAFVFSPMILPKGFIAESEVLLTTAQFAAFLVWWKGHDAGRNKLLRWALVGLLLLATASFKGPQPAAFFALGVGTYILVRRDWAQLPGYCLAGLVSLGGLALWYGTVIDSSDHAMVAQYMRLMVPQDVRIYLFERLGFATAIVQFLPATLMMVPALLDLFRKRSDHTPPGQRQLLLALALYGGVAMVPLALWPDNQPRYAMSALPAAACLAGLAFDAVLEKARELARLAIAVLLALIAYQAAWGWIVAPAAWRDFAGAAIDAEVVEAAAGDHGRPLLLPVRSADAVLAYLDRPIRYLGPDEIMAIAAPAYLMATDDVAVALAGHRPDLEIRAMARLPYRDMVVYEVNRKAGG